MITGNISLSYLTKSQLDDLQHFLENPQLYCEYDYIPFNVDENKLTHIDDYPYGYTLSGLINSIFRFMKKRLPEFEMNGVLKDYNENEACRIEVSTNGDIINVNYYEF